MCCARRKLPSTCYFVTERHGQAGETGGPSLPRERRKRKTAFYTAEIPNSQYYQERKVTP